MSKGEVSCNSVSALTKELQGEERGCPSEIVFIAAGLRESNMCN